MATSTRRRGMSSTSRRAKAAAADSLKQLFKDWVSLTFATDRQRMVGPITPTILNWIFVGTIVALAWSTAGNAKPLGIAVIAWLALTSGRAQHVQRRRRRTCTSIYEELSASAKLPAGTATNPVNPHNHIHKLKWGARVLPSQFSVKLNSSAPAASAPLLRGEVEVAIENIPHLHQKAGGEWLFSWNKSTVTAVSVASNDPRISQKAYTRKITALIQQIFGITKASAAGWAVDVEGWETAQTADGGSADYPSLVIVTCANKDLTDPILRDRVERHFERAVPTPAEWLFTWDTNISLLKAQAADGKSLEAQRKRIRRRLSDDMNGLVSRPGKDPIVVEVVDWVSEDQPIPRRLHASFGTLSFDDPRKIDSLEDGFDQVVNNRWPEGRALFAWNHGATTELGIDLVPNNDHRALRRVALTRFRSVTQSKFGSARNPVTTEVLEWKSPNPEDTEALPQKARVNFGTVDVTSLDTRDAFQDHWDSITDANDWRYKWNAPQGYVEMTAVSTLATAVAFPNPDDELHQVYTDHFRRGKIILGPQKGGGYFVWDLSKVAHALVGGRTGAGKSVLLDVILYLILSNSDMAELVVCDPKMTDFTWTTEFPDVRFAAGVEDICNAIDWLHGEMVRRQRLLNRRGVRDIGYLRKLYEEHPEFLAEDGGVVPKRIFLLFDEIANFLGASANKDLEELKDVTRTQLESIGQLGRAMWINMTVAAQKPEAKYVSTQLKQMCEARLCVGPVDEYTSKQILESNHGTRFGEGTPKGRAWASTSELGFNVIQVPYLPSASEPAPWDPSITIEGSRDRLRAKLRAEGYVQIMQPNADGGREPRWVRVEDTDADDKLPMPADLPDDAADPYLQEDADETRPETLAGQELEPDDEVPWATE